MLHTTPQERLALGVVALLMAAGAGVRLAAERPAEGAEWSSGGGGADTLHETLSSDHSFRVDEAIALEAVRSEPLAEGERIDVNAAPAEELERLPRVGPALAARIVARREERGPFRTLGDLDAVEGVGTAMLAALAPRVTLPAGPAATGMAGTPEVLALNHASAAELETLPGLGPALALRIVRWREEHGPFRSLEQLEEVPGIGPALRARLAPRLRVEP